MCRRFKSGPRHHLKSGCFALVGVWVGTNFVATIGYKRKVFGLYVRPERPFPLPSPREQRVTHTESDLGFGTSTRNGQLNQQKWAKLEERHESLVQQVIAELSEIGVSAHAVGKSPFYDEFADLPRALVEIKDGRVRFVRFHSVAPIIYFWIPDPQINSNFPHVAVHTSRETPRWKASDPDDPMEEPEEYFYDGLDKELDGEFSVEIANKLNLAPDLQRLALSDHIKVQSDLTDGCWVVDILVEHIAKHDPQAGVLQRLFRPVKPVVDVFRFLGRVGKKDDPGSYYKRRELLRSDWEELQAIARVLTSTPYSAK